MDDLLKDPRFAHVAKDPRFRRIPKAERKVKIDKRFQSMFSDKKFNVRYTIDKRGRPSNQTSSENLKKYYELSTDDDDDDDDDGDDGDEDDEDENKKSIDDKNEKSVEDKKKKIKNKSKNRKDSNVIDESKVNLDESDSAQQRKLSKSKKKLTKSKPQLGTGNLLIINKPRFDSDSESNDNLELKENSNSDSESISSSETKTDLQDSNEALKINKSETKSITPQIKQKLRDLTVDYARGEGALLTESSSEEESSDEDDEEDEIAHDWGELDKEAETTDEITNRLAACNMDWDRIRAVDLMVLFNSFLPPNGLIHSITIYPSEFGLRRMKEEEIKGPIELVESKNGDRDIGEDEDENEEGSKYHMEKLRQYQLNRLKYYYAVIICDTPQTANKIYTECDGIEYESTATKLDLRFIPDDTTFDEEPKEVCDQLPELSKYQPRQFTTTALQQVKVQLTWDETNPERQEITQKLNSGKTDDIDPSDIQAYLASGSSDEADSDDDKLGNNSEQGNSESENDKDPIEKYKSLLRGIEKQQEENEKNDVQMEITWGLGTKAKSEKLIAEKLKQNEELTPFEQYLEKRKAKKKAKTAEKKKLREKNDDESENSDSRDSVPSDVDMNDPYFAEEYKNAKPKSKKKSSKNQASEVTNSSDQEQQNAELELLLMDKTEDEGRRHFDMKKIEEDESASKSKKKRQKKLKKYSQKTETIDDFKINVKDQRFEAIFSSHHFNIDPADQRFRKTKGTEALIEEKMKRRADGELEQKAEKKVKTERKLNAELSALVKSVKRKSQNISQRIK